jgi:hypothetical protein
MEHVSLYRDSVKGTWSEGSYIEDSDRHIMGGSGNGAFILMDSISGT